MYTDDEIITKVLDVAFDIHRQLGPGLFESVYEKIMEYELVQTLNFHVVRQQPIPVYWKEMKIDVGFRTDLMVEEQILVEVKSIAAIAPVHKQQLLTHLRLTDLRRGILINFNEALLKRGICRMVNGY